MYTLSFFSDGVVEEDGDGSSVTKTTLFGRELVAVVESLLGILDLEKVRSSNASAKLGNTFIRSQMSNSGEKLINATGELFNSGSDLVTGNGLLGQN